MLSATRSQPIGVAVQRSKIESGEVVFEVEVEGCTRGPFDAQPKGIQSHCATMGKVLLIAVPKICRRSSAHDKSLRLQFRPVVVRLVGTIVTAFALVAGTGNPPEKFFVHGARGLKLFRIEGDRARAILALYATIFPMPYLPPSACEVPFRVGVR